MASLNVETTAQLLARIRQGDGQAKEQMVEKFLSKLKRWTHGRLPDAYKDLQETDDLVQNTLTKALAGFPTIERRGQGAFLA